MSKSEKSINLSALSEFASQLIAVLKDPDFLKKEAHKLEQAVEDKKFGYTPKPGESAESLVRAGFLGKAEGNKTIKPRYFPTKKGKNMYELLFKN